MLAIEKIIADHGPSMGVIIQACRVFFDNSTADELNKLIQLEHHNWKQIAGLSRQHRIRPIVYRALLQSELPASIRKALEIELKILLQIELKKTNETYKIAELLQSKSIDALPYKGATYSFEFFGEYGMRETGDIDLAINKLKLQEINTILSDRGYKPDQKDFYEYLGHKTFCNRYRGYNYIKEIDGLIYYVENHWGMLEDFNLITNTPNNFNLTNKKKLDDSNFNVYTLNKFEHFKAIFLHHTIQEGLTYLKTIVDLAQGLKVLGAPETSYEKELIKNLISHHKLKEVALLSKLLFGIENQVFQIGKIQTSTLIRLPFLVERKSVKEKKSYTFIDYFQYHTKLISARIFFTQGSFAKFLFFTKAAGRIFKYDIDDFRWVQFPRKFIGLYHLIRPFRKILFPANPIKKIPKIN